MKVAMIQPDLVWENPAANRQMLGSMIRKTKADLAVLPEMFTTGFSMSPERFAEEMDGPTVGWMTDLAAELQMALTGSIIIREGANFYNRLLFVKPDGSVATYDKRHLFTLAGEDQIYTAGSDRLVVEYMGFRICPLICYDLRFPVFARNDVGYDMLIYVANWPEPRISAWDILLRARAVENLCYVVGVNRTGVDGNNHRYTGSSAVIDYSGKEVQKLSDGIVSVTAEASLSDLQQWRARFGFLNDRDKFGIIN